MVALLTLSYRGTAYAGWQRQENALAVQQVVEEALARLLGLPEENIRIVGASRTHQLDSVAHLFSPVFGQRFPIDANTWHRRDSWNAGGPPAG